MLTGYMNMQPVSVMCIAGVTSVKDGSVHDEDGAFQDAGIRIIQCLRVRIETCFVEARNSETILIGDDWLRAHVARQRNVRVAIIIFFCWPSYAVFFEQTIAAEQILKI